MYTLCLLQFCMTGLWNFSYIIRCHFVLFAKLILKITIKAFMHIILGKNEEDHKPRNISKQSDRKQTTSLANEVLRRPKISFIIMKSPHYHMFFLSKIRNEIKKGYRRLVSLVQTLHVSSFSTCNLFQSKFPLTKL